MKLFAFILATLAVLPAIHAEANSSRTAAAHLKFAQENGKRVESHDLAIVGRGISLADQSESLALACTETIENKCKKINWIYFSAHGEAFEVGLPLEVTIPDSLSSPQVKALVQERMKEYKQTARNDRLWNNITGKSNSAAYLVGSYALALLVVGANPVGMIAVTGAALVANAIMFTRGGEFGGFLLNANSGTNQAFYDQNGWNWATRTKKLSVAKFNRFFNMATGPIVTIEMTRQ